MADSVWFTSISMAVTVREVVWVGVDVDKNHKTFLYAKAPLDQVLDHFFCLFFAMELAIRLGACQSNSRVPIE